MANDTPSMTVPTMPPRELEIRSHRVDMVLVPVGRPGPLADEHAVEIVAGQRPQDVVRADAVQPAAKRASPDDVLDNGCLPGAAVLGETQLQIVQFGNHRPRRAKQAQLRADRFVDVRAIRAADRRWSRGVGECRATWTRSW